MCPRGRARTCSEGLLELQPRAAHFRPAKALVLLHNLTDNGLCWSRLAAALEAECCPFLSFAVQESGDDLFLTVKPAAGAAPDAAQSLAMLTSLTTGHRCSVVSSRSCGINGVVR